MIRIDLPELGDDQYVEILDPKWLPWGAQKKFTAKLKDESLESYVESAEELALALIKKGNVVDENGVPFEFPLTSETITKFPALAIDKVLNKYKELSTVKVDRKN